jgi:lipid II:glycine glycyltransferase (peptidoglycan interpeptide bridge formation enzyme)
VTTLSVRSITRQVHQGWVETAESASFLQTPEWADVKKEWRSESIGWFTAEDELVGAGSGLDAIPESVLIREPSGGEMIPKQGILAVRS